MITDNQLGPLACKILHDELQRDFAGKLDPMSYEKLYGKILRVAEAVRRHTLADALHIVSTATDELQKL